MLDVDTTSEDNPQLVSMEAELYSSNLRLVAEMVSVVKPRNGYAVMRHMQDVRHHGVTAEMMSDKGDDAAKALGNMLAMIRQGTGKASLADTDDGKIVIVVAHGTQGMIANLMAAARVDETLHQYWDELEALIQRTDDTLPLCVQEFPLMNRCTLEWAVAATGNPLPKSRARAVALLYRHFRKFGNDGW